MSIPPFSLFSAISEIFVTLVLVYGIVTGIRTGDVPKRAMGAVLLFELCVNITYMAGRASAADRSDELSPAMKLFFAAHGSLSLVLFLALGVLYLHALHGATRNEKVWFHRHPNWSWALVGLWMVSMLTGEAIFAVRYLL